MPTSGVALVLFIIITSMSIWVEQLGLGLKWSILCSPKELNVCQMSRLLLRLLLDSFYDVLSFTMPIDDTEPLVHFCNNLVLKGFVSGHKIGVHMGPGHYCSLGSQGNCHDVFMPLHVPILPYESTIHKTSHLTSY